jgi:hypothetical protein
VKKRLSLLARCSVSTGIACLDHPDRMAADVIGTFVARAVHERALPFA